MSLVAPRMFTFTLSRLRGRVSYTSICVFPQRKISKGLRSGDFGGHSICPLSSIHLPGRTLSIFSTRQPYEVVLRPAESQIDVRVAFHPRAVPTHQSTAADTVRHSLLLPGTLGPKECFHVSRTTWLFLGEFGDGHRLQHDGYPASRTRHRVRLLINCTRNTLHH